MLPFEDDYFDLIKKELTKKFEKIKKGNKIEIVLKDGASKVIKKEPGLSLFELLDSLGIPKEKIINTKMMKKLTLSILAVVFFTTSFVSAQDLDKVLKFKILFCPKLF